jgi:hypothetical protein
MTFVPRAAVAIETGEMRRVDETQLEEPIAVYILESLLCRLFLSRLDVISSVNDVRKPGRTLPRRATRFTANDESASTLSRTASAS